MSINYTDKNGLAYLAAKIKALLNDKLDKKVNIVTRYTISTATWSTTTTTVNSIAYYTYVISLTDVNDAFPTVFLGNDTPPTSAEQDAYNCIKYATVDASAMTLTLYAETAPTADFYIRVKGVK